MIQETRFNTTIRKYTKEQLDFENSEIINQKVVYSDTLSTIDIYIIGDELSSYQIADLNRKLNDYGLNYKGNYLKRIFFSITDSTVLRVHQSTDDTDAIFSQLDYLSNNLSKDIRTGILEDIYKKNEEIIQFKDQQITFLENQLVNLKKDTIPIQLLSKEIKVHFPKIIKFGYGKTIETALDGNIDTLPIFFVQWNGYAWKAQRKEQKEIIERWLKVKLKLDTLRVFEY